ncbi:MAG: SDR family NAD(P)-dependent oxidoreductase [Moraxellaceae bacterium]|jgi:short-subunit dehydrogenase|nr:SDR family NAD(P)-dependent oxidoreductase [Moraxellaceae bacterium]MBP9730710.1 SDR family NAD(P)-dependent oxidoreductase [Moraxellaceae bacterium]HQX89991.1 SDR family NAD(P)-dependent oxidoreductase [Moraxellaceae bacterium]
MSLNPAIRDWSSQRVWVVGASSGIGQALSKSLLERGAKVAISARKEQPLAFLAESFPESALAVPFDVNQESGWHSAHENITRTWGGIDIMVFCAAAYTPMHAWELDVHVATGMIDTNISGAIKGLAAVLPDMLKSGSGHISLVASVAGYMGLPKSLIYGPTKAALINMAESLYLDVHERGIGVSVINPGFVDTPLTKGNDFKMPSLITPETAAGEIIRGFEKGLFEIHFPKKFTAWLRLIRRLPYSLRFRLLSKVST